MNAFKILRRTAAMVAALVLTVSVMVGQNVTNNGTMTNTGTMTANNFTNSGAPATFTNSGGASLFRIRGTLNTTAAGALATNFDVTNGEVRYIGNAAQTINGSVLNSTYNNLSTTGAGASTKTLGGNVTVAGTLTSDGAGVIVDVGTFALTVTGATPITSANSGAFTFTGGTVNYGGGAQNIFTADYGTLGVTAAGNKTMGGNSAVNTGLNLTLGNLQIGANTLTIAGAITTTGGTLEGSGTSNMTFSGTGNAAMPSVTNGLGTLVINRTGATDVVTLGGSLTVATALTLTDGDLHVGSLQTLTLNNTVSAASGTLSSETDGTVGYAQGSAGQAVLATNYGSLSFSNFNKTLPAGSVGVAGTFTAGTATGHTIAGNTLVFNGGAQDIPSFNGATGYNNLTTSGGVVTKTVTGSIVVAGNFVNGGDVTTNVQANSLSITGTRSQGNAAATMQFSANNGLVFTTGTVEYNGAAQNITGDVALKYANLLLSGSGTKTVLAAAANTVHTTAGLSVGANITLSVTGGGFLNVGDTGTGIGTLTLAGLSILSNSGDVNVAGDLVNDGSVTNSGSITVGY